MTYLRVSVAVSMIFASAVAVAAAPDTAAGKKMESPGAAKYCIESEPFTGSKVIKTECKTKAEWAKEGVNVDQLKK